MRRTLTIVAVVVVVLGIAAGIYYFFFAKGASLEVGDTPVTNPFGGVGDGTGGATGGSPAGISTTTEEETAVAATPAPRLVEIAKGPVADGMAMVRITVPAVYGPPTGSSTVPTVVTATSTDTEVRYIDRASGNVYAYQIRADKLTRTSNRTAPGIQEASWLADGSLAYARSVVTDADGTAHAETYALPANGIGGFALPRDLAQAFAAEGSSLLALASGVNGSVATVSKTDGTAGKTAFSTPLGQITAFAAKSGYFAETNPSAAAAGYAFSAGTAFTRLLGPLPGLSILPNHAGTKLIVSYLDGSALRLASYDLASRELTALPVSTLAEKCAWTADDASAYCAVPVALPSGTLPDDWYQGAVSFTDRIWKIDFSSRVAELTLNLPTAAKTDIDAVSLTLDQDTDALSFVNKLDGSLWSYDL
jgi:hypothetical protein